MKVNVIIIVLGIYIFAMGMLGAARTASLIPLFIGGSIASVTIWLGWLLGKGIRSIRNVTLTWLGLNVVVMGYMTFGRMSGHAEPGTGSIYIFGSMALMALIAWVLVFRSRPDQWSGSNRRCSRVGNRNFVRGK